MGAKEEGHTHLHSRGGGRDTTLETAGRQLAHAKPPCILPRANISVQLLGGILGPVREQRVQEEPGVAAHGKHWRETGVPEQLLPLG